MKNIIIGSIGLCLLAGCATGPRPDHLTTFRDGTKVTGSAGANWTDENLRSNQFQAICEKTETVTNLVISPRDDNGRATYSAECLT